MCQLVVVGFEWRIVQQDFAPHCKHSYRRLLHHVLDLGMGFASFAFVEWVYSRCAEGSCDSSVLSYDRCNTQLCAGLIAFRFHFLSGRIPLTGHICCLSFLLGLFLHFQRCIHMFVLLTCPLRLDLSTFFEASILLGKM